MRFDLIHILFLGALAAVSSSCGDEAPQPVPPPGAPTTASLSASRLKVEISGGHDTDARDHGRPVILIAGALGVSPEVFREAFSRVHPAPAGREPAPRQVRENKEALMSALGPRGVTNERLDEVSNYYRYNPGRGEMWPTRPAVAYAALENGVVTGFEIVDGGSGYSSLPTLSVPGLSPIAADVTLAFSSDFLKNGSIAAISKRP